MYQLDCCGFMYKSTDVCANSENSINVTKKADKHEDSIML